MEYEKLLLIGGTHNGKFYEIPKGFKTFKVPTAELQPVIFSKEEEQPSVTITHETYERHEYRDSFGTVGTFLIYHGMTEEQVKTELYLLKVIDTEGNFETGEA